jgi:cell division protein FtsW
MHRKSIYFLVLAVAALLTLGLVMLYSTSAYTHEARLHGDPYYFLKRQAIWLGVGVFLCAAAARFNYHFWERTWYIWFSLSLILLALCFVPGIGGRINGSYRWIHLRYAAFQPSELAKLAAVCALAWWFSRDDKTAGEFFRGFIVPLFIVGLLAALIAPEVDLGTTVLIGATAYAVMFVAGTRLRYLIPVVIIGVLALGFVAMHMPDRINRLLAFTHPEQHAASAYQTQQGLIAFGSGGTEGRGLGNGRQKIGYLPEPHTDSILPTIGEELGLRCTLSVVFLYIVLIMSGTIIASHSRDRFGLLLGFGIVVLIALQAAVNIGVTTALLPNKGMPLPFISYGGSNLAFCLLCIGILINIYREGASDREQRTASFKLAVTTKPTRMVRI